MQARREATRRSFLSGLLVGTVAFLAFGVAIGGLILLLTPGRRGLDLALDTSTAFGFHIAVVSH